MRKYLAIFMPGEYLARKIDKEHAEFVERIKKETRKGSRKLRVFHCFAIFEHFLAVTVGLAAGYLGYFFLVPIAFVLWPLVAWGDLRLWRSTKIYGRIAEGSSFRVSLLGNFDLFHLFALGCLVSWVIP
jgi:hypothetical protein